jgi:hypothetical protein
LLARLREFQGSCVPAGTRNGAEEVSIMSGGSCIEILSEASTPRGVVENRERDVLLEEEEASTACAPANAEASSLT